MYLLDDNLFLSQHVLRCYRGFATTRDDRPTPNEALDQVENAWCDLLDLEPYHPKIHPALAYKT
jgi:hypothetical protein